MLGADRKIRKATAADAFAYARTNPEGHSLYGFAVLDESRCPIEELPATDSARYEVLAPDGLKWSGDLDSLVCQNLADLRERLAQETLEPGDPEEEEGGDPPPDASPSYTREYFRSQVAELTHRLGTKSFWSNPDAPFIAAQAISKVYLHTEDGEQDADIYAFAIREIAMRHAYVLAMPEADPFEGERL